VSERIGPLGPISSFTLAMAVAVASLSHRSFSALIALMREFFIVARPLPHPRAAFR
jgi:hypothetical protein